MGLLLTPGEVRLVELTVLEDVDLVEPCSKPSEVAVELLVGVTIPPDVRDVLCPPGEGFWLLGIVEGKIVVGKMLEEDGGLVDP